MKLEGGDMTDDGNNKLLYYRKRSGLTQEQVAEKLGMTQQGYAPYERGIREMRSSMLKSVAQILNVSVTELLGLENEPWLRKAKPATATIPVYGRIAAGDAREAIQDPDGHWYAPDSILVDHPQSFYLRVSGDSMNKLFPDGSLVLIDPDAEVHSNDIAAVLVNGFDATLKRIFFAGDTIVLHPESYNPKHHDQTIDQTDPDAPLFRVVGKAISYTAPEGWKA